MLEIARSESPLTHPIASQYRDAMILGVLAHRPLRRRNIANLALGVHLTQDAGKWYCHIPDTETKDRRPIEFVLPQDPGFAACFSYYLQTVRQKLLKHHPIDRDALHTLTGPLWVSTRGRILTDHALYYAVTRISEELLGEPIYPISCGTAPPLPCRVMRPSISSQPVGSWDTVHSRQPSVIMSNPQCWLLAQDWSNT